MADLATASSELDSTEVAELSVIDVGVSQESAIMRGRVDINFFAGLVLPAVMISALPSFYLTTFTILTSRNPEQIGKILRFALGLPRGHAKTTFIKIIICWLIAYDRVSFALMVCASEALAEQLLADVNDMMGSSNMEAVFGPWNQGLSTDTKELKKCLYHGRPVILAAKGAGSAVRGLNIKHTRPDLIFCDDMQTKENDESPTESLRLLRWMIATLLKLLAPRGDRLVIYVGNMYSDNCILKKLQTNPGWTSLVTGAILDNGEPLWPELHSLEDLMESYIHDEALGESDIWFAEVMNDPKATGTTLVPTALPVCPYEIDTTESNAIVPDGVFITIDPAGFKDVSDDNVIVVHYVYDGKGIVAAVEMGILDPGELIRKALELALIHGASLIGIEDVGYQQTLGYWVNKYMLETGITGIVIVALNPHGRSKEARIRQFISELYAENYYIGGSIRPAYIWQATKYKIGNKKNKDDLLDAVAYGLDIRNEHWQHVKNLRTSSLKRITASVQANNTPF